MTIYSAKMLGETYRIRGNFAEASSQVERDTGDDWNATGMQVANFGHDPVKAMRYELNGIITESGDDPEDFKVEIDTAIANMTDDDD